MKQHTLLTAPIRRLYLGFLVPTLIATVSNSLYCLADVYFISIGSGTMGLAALNIVMPMYTFYSAIGLLFGVGASTIIAVDRGSGNEHGADVAFTISIAMMVLFGLAGTLLSLFFLEPLAYLLGSSAKLLPYVMEYLRPIVIGTLAFILMYACGILLRADNAPRLAMVSMLIGNISNIVLDYVFVIVFGWGLGGAAFATALAPLITLIIASLHFVGHKERLHFSRITNIRAILRRIVVNGAGSGILELTSGLVILVFNAVILAVSDATFLAAYAIVANIAYVLKGVFAAFGQAAQPIMSYNYGAHAPGRTRETFRFSMFLTLAVSLLIYLLFCFFHVPLASLFASGEAEVLALGAFGIVLYFTSLPFSAFNTILMYYFQSVESGRLATVLAIAKGVVFILIGLLLLYALLGETGIWLTVTFAEAAACLLGIALYRRRCRGEERG